MALLGTRGRKVATQGRGAGAVILRGPLRGVERSRAGGRERHGTPATGRRFPSCFGPLPGAAGLPHDGAVMSWPERILVVRTDRVGDVVLATPLVRALRRAFP